MASPQGWPPTAPLGSSQQKDAGAVERGGVDMREGVSQPSGWRSSGASATRYQGVRDGSTASGHSLIATHIGVMPHLDLSDEEEAVVAVEWVQLISRTKYPLSDRVRTLGAILNKLRPERARPAASPEPRVYEPPSNGRSSRRG